MIKTLFSTDERLSATRGIARNALLEQGPDGDIVLRVTLDHNVYDPISLHKVLSANEIKDMITALEAVINNVRMFDGLVARAEEAMK